MDFVVYILYSYSADKYYIGYSSGLIQRYYWHHHSKKGFTCKYRPWAVIHVEFFETKAEALEREKVLKGGQGRAWMKSHFDKSAGFISARGGGGFNSLPRYKIHRNPSGGFSYG